MDLGRPPVNPHLCEALTPQQEFAKQQCEIELKAADCDGWYHKDPAGAVNGRSCTTMAVCPSPTSVSDFAIMCSGEIWKANVDLGATI